MLSLLRPCSLNRSLPGSPRPSWKTAQKLPPQMKGQDQTSQVRLVTWVCAPSAPHAGPPRASLLVLAADVPHLPGWPWLVAACSPRCPRHQSHPTHPWPHVGSGDLLCPMSSCLVYVRVSGCDPELASPFKFLPLGSAHTVHKASQRNATWKKKIHPRRRKNTSQQNVLFSAGSSAWLQFSQCLPLGCGVCTPLLFPPLQHQQGHLTTGQGKEHPQAVPIFRAHPSS